MVGDNTSRMSCEAKLRPEPTAFSDLAEILRFIQNYEGNVILDMGDINEFAYSSILKIKELLRAMICKERRVFLCNAQPSLLEQLEERRIIGCFWIVKDVKEARELCGCNR